MRSTLFHIYFSLTYSLFYFHKSLNNLHLPRKRSDHSIDISNTHFLSNPQPSFPSTWLPNKCPATSLDTEQTRQNKPPVRTIPNFDSTTGFPALTTIPKSRISGDEGRVPSFQSVGNSPFAALYTGIESRE
ncbi:hypothetical protein TNCT_217341 [Trichonephila clavata]|uniref:Uncharacterized protein n=1 Tax=Trichonephila clavata TaxID=2740835 RepID=A0A8X6KN98_TRICU|nr:hypothetical protein TNCT_217341 [Trichonephila clavata]